MKAVERKEARQLRKQGFSLKEISRKIRCAKSSISNWVRDIPLTPGQIERLESKQDRARARAANHPNSPKRIWADIRNNLSDSACREMPAHCSSGVLRILGSALYWAEGNKADFNVINFSNSDPKMVALMMRFFREICKVPEGKFRGAVHIYPHLDVKKAVKFWSEATGIPLSQFHKTQFGISRASKNKRDTLPRGTFTIIVCDTRLKARLNGWIQGIEKWNSRALSSVG
jgi:hypothetical protein